VYVVIATVLPLVGAVTLEPSDECHAYLHADRSDLDDIDDESDLLKAHFSAAYATGYIDALYDEKTISIDGAQVYRDEIQERRAGSPFIMTSSPLTSLNPVADSKAVATKSTSTCALIHTSWRNSRHPAQDGKPGWTPPWPTGSRHIRQAS
jgi:hypothetical protein